MAGRRAVGDDLGVARAARRREEQQARRARRARGARETRRERQERTGPPSRRGTWLRWVGATVAGELIGLGGAGVLAVIAVAVAGEDPAAAVAVVLFALMLGAGAMEGAVLGAAQSFVLRRLLADFRSAPWIAATAAGALLAWMLGAAVVMSLPEDADLGGLLPLWVLLGLATGTILGAAQWVVLRRYVERAGWWVAGSAAAWGLGLVVPFVSASSAPEQTGLAVLVALVTGLLTGITPGAVTGWVLVRLLALPD